MKKSRPVLLTFSVLAALDVIAAGGALGDIIGLKAFALFVLVLAAVKAGMGFWVQSQTIPYRDALAFIDDKGEAIAGPAGPIMKGQPVDVVSTPVDTSRS